MDQTPLTDPKAAEAAAAAAAKADADKAAGKKTAAMTKAQAAKRVKRSVIVEGEDGQPATKLVPVTEDEVLDFKDYGTHVVVVTTDGQKLSSAAAA